MAQTLGDFFDMVAKVVTEVTGRSSSEIKNIFDENRGSNKGVKGIVEKLGEDAYLEIYRRLRALGYTHDELTI